MYQAITGFGIKVYIVICQMSGLHPIHFEGIELGVGCLIMYYSERYLGATDESFTPMWVQCC